MKKLLFTTIAILSIACYSFTLKKDGSKKVNILVAHEVEDYIRWKKAFDAGAANREKAGIKVIAVYQVSENPNTIVGIMEAASQEVAQKYFDNPALKAAMEKAGVISVPEIKILNQVQ